MTYSARTRWWILLAPAAWLSGAAFGDQKEDDRLHDEVMLRLNRDSKLRGGSFQVSVKDSEVTITGKVRSEQQKARVAQTTAKVKGVKKVITEVTVEPY